MTDSLPPEVTEIAMVSTNAVGYFAQPEHADDLDHGKRGAYGQWSAINEDNTTDDFVHFGRCAKPWNGGGGFTWSIPNAWRVAGDPFATNVFTRTDQRFELDADGTARVSKFGWTGERGTNDTHRVYGGGEPMKYKCVIVVALSVFACFGGITTNSPLSLLRKGWGKGSIVDFRKVAYENLPLLFDEGGTAAVEGWCNELVDYPDFWKETETIYWMEAKASTLSFCVYMQFLGASTNSWFAAANLLSRYRMLVQEAESNANIKIDFPLAKTDPKRFNELLNSRKRLRKNAWNLKCVTTSLARVVTNEFPKSVLPALPEPERDKMMSEVLVRAGIVDAGKDSAREAIGRSSSGFFVLLVVFPLVLIACCVYRR